MRHTLLLLSFFLTRAAFSQSSLQDKLLQTSFEDITIHTTTKRKLLHFKKRSSRYNPATYVSAGLLYVYQNVFSEQLQAECSYEISCSEYTKLSIQRSGFFIGVLSGFNQLSECYPGVIYEHPRSFIGPGNKVINSITHAAD